MVSYVITGASRGIGYELIRQLSQDKSNVVVGLVRNKAATEERLAKDGVTNVTIYQADITDAAALHKASAATAKLTGGGLDFLINNAAYLSEPSALVDLSHFENSPEILNQELLESFQVNVIGVAKTVTAFLPLIKQGKAKKVITLSTGLADPNLINGFSIGMGAPYTVSKAAVNSLVAKYNVAYGSQGILFMSISPGFVDTSEGKSMSPEELKLVAPMVEAFKKYNPAFTGPITPQQSVESVMKLATRATVEDYGGSFVSHHGDQNWL